MNRSILLSLMLLTGCDAPAPEGDIEFRLGEPKVLYLSQYDAEISVFDFAQIVQACPSKEKLAITFTRYPKHATGLDSQVIGLGFSVSADSSWAQCYEDLMLDMGAHP